MDLTKFIRDIPDFPKEGIIFKDITPLLKSHEALTYAVDLIYRHYADERITAIAGIESRGFIFGCPVAGKFGVGFIPIRKPGKLPYETVSEEYELEYGTDCVEMHVDAAGPGDKVLIVDDLLATGGTAAATRHLIEQTGATVAGFAFVIELGFLNGKEKLEGVPVYSLIKY
ncbi:MAG: adenine phosphoribosyltransferase [bacterium]